MGRMSYFPLFFDMEGRRVLVTGAGKVAVRRIRVLLEAGASVTVVARELSEEAKALITVFHGGHDIVLHKMDYREFRERAAQGRKETGKDGGSYFLVLAATGDEEADRLAAEDGRKAGAFVNVAGKKEKSDFYFPGIARQGDVVAGITAGGRDHRMAKYMTQAVQECLKEELTGRGNDE